VSGKTLKPVIEQTSAKSFSTLIWKTIPSAGLRGPVNLKVDVIEGKDTTRHIIFLHGLFGRGQSFQFLAKAKAIQKNFTCHLIDLCNHGNSDRSSLMDYESLARDV